MKKISSKIIFVSILSCVLVALLIGTVSVLSINDLADRNGKTIDSSMRQNFDMTAKYEVQTAIAVLQDLYDRSQKGEISIEEAKKIGANTIRNLRYNKDGYFWIDTTKGINVVLPTDKDKKVEGTSRYDAQDKKGNYYVHDFIDNGLKEEGGYSDYWFTRLGKDEPVPKRSYTLAFKPFDWVVGTGNYIDDIDETVLKYNKEAAGENTRTYIVMIVALLVSLIIAFIMSLFLGTRISHPILKVTELINRTSKFNLIYDKSFEPLLKNKDETGTIAKAIFDMRSIMHVMVEKIITVSGSLAKHSGELSVTSENNVRTLNQIVTTINELAGGNSSQAELITKTNEKISGVVKTINEISDETFINSENASKSLDMVLVGDNAVLKQAQRMSENVAISSEVGRSIQELSTMIEKVGNIVSVINSIASQTNLLALNAAIEAARAGEAGKGFAVVSEEIRKLAEGSSDAAKEISQIVNNTVVKSKLTIENIEKAALAVSSQEEALNETKEAFKNIKISVREIAEKTKHSAEKLKQVDNMSNDIYNQSQDMSAVAEESAASMQEISATSEEQLASFEMVAKASADLSKMAEELSKEISRFDVK